LALIENGTTLGTVLDTGSWCPAAGELSATAGRCAHAARRPALATLDGEVLVVEHGLYPSTPISLRGPVALEARCAGVKSAVPGTENIQVNGADDSAVTSTLQAKLSQDKSIDWIVTLGAQALDSLKAIPAAGSSAKLITFDLNADAAQAIKDGKIEFSIDQQPYVQGFMAVSSLYLYLKNGNDIGGGKAVLTGPSFVDKNNIDTILPFAKSNTR